MADVGGVVPADRPRGRLRDWAAGHHHRRVEYLDFSSGIAVTSTGHCHPHVVAAIQDQAARFIHAQVNVYRHTASPSWPRLAAITPSRSTRSSSPTRRRGDRVGGEAGQAGPRAANVIVFQGSFHGRTHLAMAMTTRRPCTGRTRPAPVGRVRGAVPQGGRRGRRLPRRRAPAPAQPDGAGGDGGDPHRPCSARGLHPRLRLPPGPRGDLREHGILFVADEVQSGFGRTGTMFCVEQHGIRPDVVVMAKGLASGFPISAVGASPS